MVFLRCGNAAIHVNSVYSTQIGTSRRLYFWPPKEVTGTPYGWSALRHLSLNLAGHQRCRNILPKYLQYHPVPGHLNPLQRVLMYSRLAADVKSRWSFAPISGLFSARLGPIRPFTTQSGCAFQDDCKLFVFC